MVITANYRLLQITNPIISTTILLIALKSLQGCESQTYHVTKQLKISAIDIIWLLIQSSITGATQASPLVV